MTVRAIRQACVGLPAGGEAWIHHGREYADDDELVAAFPDFFEPIRAAPDVPAPPRIGRPRGSRSKPKPDEVASE